MEICRGCFVHASLRADHLSVSSDATKRAAMEKRRFARDKQDLAELRVRSQLETLITDV